MRNESVKNLNEKGTFLLSYMHELRAELSSYNSYIPGNGNCAKTHC